MGVATTTATGPIESTCTRRSHRPLTRCRSHTKWTRHRGAGGQHQPDGDPDPLHLHAGHLVASSTQPRTGDGLERRRTTYGYDPAGRKTSQGVGWSCSSSWSARSGSGTGCAINVMEHFVVPEKMATKAMLLLRSAEAPPRRPYVELSKRRAFYIRTRSMLTSDAIPSSLLLISIEI